MKPQFDLEPTTCNLCNSENRRVVLVQAKEHYIGLQARFDVVACRECGHHYTHPRPTPQTIGVFYPDTAGYYSPQEVQKLGSSLKDRLFRQTLSDQYGYTHLADSSPMIRALGKIFALIRKRGIACRHIPRFSPDAKVLDVGCSHGGYLEFLRRLGFSDLHGIEMNQAAVTYANQNLGLKNVRQGSLDELDYPDEYFDCVHLSMVLEHAYQPLQLLKRVSRTLKKGGEIILSVPDFSGIEARYFKSDFYGLQVPQHLHHFLPKTLQKILTDSGFLDIRVFHQATDRDLFGSLLIRKSPWTETLQFPLVRKLLLRPLFEFLSMLGQTSRMSVYAKKR